MSGYDDDLRAGDEEMIGAFGRPVRLPARSEPIMAVFDEPYARIDLPHAGFIAGTVTTLTAFSGDVDGLAARDVISVPKKRALDADDSLIWDDWIDYVVKEIQPDGTGLSVIWLDPKTGSENSAYSKY